MNNFIINSVKVSEEQYNRIKNIRQLPDEEIDFSDIPPISKEELKKFKPARLREKNLNVAS
ncbi:MAG: hypothetical protein IKZ58_06110 [Selenomonadaceae bacterium]|nr:hypothetical protein [Selenomonadaceae bacterium]